MKKIIVLNIGCIIAFAIMAYLVYHLLINDLFLPTSIGSIIKIAKDHHSFMHKAILAALPVYISLIIFGAALISRYLGQTLQQAFDYILKASKLSNPFS